MSDCVGYKMKGNRFECNMTKYETCMDKACPFYITEKELERKQEKAKERLRSLPIDEQTIISLNYYKGKTPWEKEKRGR